MRHVRSVAMFAVACVAALASACSSAFAASPSSPSTTKSTASLGGRDTKTPAITLGIAGIPPIYLNVVAYVAEKRGYFKGKGVDVTLRPFQTGADVARVVQSGQAQAGFVGTPTMIALNASGGSLVAILGFPHPSFMIASTDEKVASCTDLKGQTVAVDGTGSPKDLALGQILNSCGLTRKDVSTLAVGGSSQVQAIVSGQVKVSVMHPDEIRKAAELLEGGKQVKPILRLAHVDSKVHYNTISVQAKSLKDPAMRQSLVKLVAALHEAIMYMKDPANVDEVAKLGAEVTKNSPTVSKAALRDYLSIGFWPSDSGLAQDAITHTIDQEIKVGNIKRANAPTAANITDQTVFGEAVRK